MAIFATLEAGDLVQSLETMRSAVALQNNGEFAVFGWHYYHGVHPVVALGVGHEGFAQLIHLLVFQLLKQRKSVTKF